MDALDEALKAHAGNATAPTADPLDAALAQHAASEGKESPTAKATKPIERPEATSLGRTFLNAIPKGAAGFGDMIPNAMVNVANLGIAGYGVGKHLLTGSTDLPELLPSDMLSGYSKLGHALGLIDDRYEPTTSPGRLVDFVGQVAGGGGVNPAAIGRALMRGNAGPAVRSLVASTASGAGAWGGSELTRDIDTGSEAADRLIKALATFGGGAAPGGFVAARGTAGERIAAATHGVSPAQWAAAEARARAAAAAGSPITGYEALQAETGLNPKMQTQQRIAEQSDAAGGGLTQLMQNRPGANEALFGRAADAIAPANPLPDTLAGRLQAAAQASIDAARAQGNAQAAPFYARSSNDPNVMIPPHDWNAIISDPAVAWALQQTRNNPLLGVQGAQAGSVQWLDAAKKFLDSRGAALTQAGDRYPGAQASGAATRITGAVDPSVPDYARARAIVANNMRTNVEPMEQSQVGKLARSDEFQQQAATLLPDKPMDVTPAVVQRTASTLNAQDPNIVRQFVGQFMRGQFNEANQQNMAGPNVFGGSKFAAQVAGNPAQEQNLVAALTSAGANPDQMLTALQIFRAQGMKPPVNSATTANAAEGAALGGVGGFMKNPISNTIGLIDQWRNGGAASDLAAALSSGGNSVGDLAGLSYANGAYNPFKQQMLANLLVANPQKKSDAYDEYIKAFDAAPDDQTRRALGDAYAKLLGLPTQPVGP